MFQVSSDQHKFLSANQRRPIPRHHYGQAGQVRLIKLKILLLGHERLYTSQENISVYHYG